MLRKRQRTGEKTSRSTRARVDVHAIPLDRLFADLLPEMWKEVLQHLDYSDIYALSRVSRTVHAATEALRTHPLCVSFPWPLPRTAALAALAKGDNASVDLFFSHVDRVGDIFGPKMYENQHASKGGFNFALRHGTRKFFESFYEYRWSPYRHRNIYPSRNSVACCLGDKWQDHLIENPDLDTIYYFARFNLSNPTEEGAWESAAFHIVEYDNLEAFQSLSFDYKEKCVKSAAYFLSNGGPRITNYLYRDLGFMPSHEQNPYYFPNICCAADMDILLEISSGLTPYISGSEWKCLYSEYAYIWYDLARRHGNDWERLDLIAKYVPVAPSIFVIANINKYETFHWKRLTTERAMENLISFLKWYRDRLSDPQFRPCFKETWDVTRGWLDGSVGEFRLSDVLPYVTPEDWEWIVSDGFSFFEHIRHFGPAHCFVVRGGPSVIKKRLDSWYRHRGPIDEAVIDEFVSSNSLSMYNRHGFEHGSMSKSKKEKCKRLLRNCARRYETPARILTRGRK